MAAMLQVNYCNYKLEVLALSGFGCLPEALPTMNVAEFVEAIRAEARDSAADEVVALLKLPPGRRPDPALLELSEWYRTLSDRDKENLRKVASLASHHAVFGVLAILDGTRAIQSLRERGRLELTYVTGDRSELINDPAKDPIHHLL